MLMCEVLERNFLANLVREHPIELKTGRTEFAKKVAESAQNLSCNWVLEYVIYSFMFLDPALRPGIYDLSTRIRNDAPEHKFTFLDFYTWHYRTNEAVRFAQTVHIDRVAAVLRELARRKKDLYRYSDLRYCFYYGIGADRDKARAISLLEIGSDGGHSFGL